jgi:hypothetical protein
LWAIPELVFEGGGTSAICMHYGDFAEVAHPVVGNIGSMAALSSCT